ncbi:hypothetical protein C8J55DRAFT_524689 [Lentinula edodes]|uniref:DUF6534 domain-containing protein n=1 Tax=Lentinula lateritia TaxID=40482 RepID=A0A9W8ZWB0_9AGAR|nr:hypothetical protein C8J55DRAFT_524689 [Lentinula edodes]
MSNTTVESHGVNVSATLDGFFYGYAVSTVLFGITVVQGWIYLNSNQDRWPFRLLVAAMVLGDFATTCLDTQSIHYYVISNFGDSNVITTITTPMAIEYLLTLIIVFCVQMFFAFTVRRLGQFHWSIYGSIILTSIGSLVAGLSAAGQLVEDNTLLGLSAENSQFEVGWECGLSALSDIITTVALCWSLNHIHTGIKRTDGLLQKLFQYSVTRGLLVSIDQTLFLILFLTKTQKLWWLPFHLCSSKIYVNTMVAMLNSRNDLLRTFDGNGIITDSNMPVQSKANVIVVENQSSKPDSDIGSLERDKETILSGSNSELSRDYDHGISELAVCAIRIPLRKGTEIGTFNNNYIEMANQRRKGILVMQEELPPQDI